MAQNWFKHDYSARNDEKILELRAEYGWEGYGIFFGLVEFMCETETGCIDTDRIGGLSVGYGVAKDRLLAIIDFCISIDLFYVDDDGLVRNDRVLKHLESMKTFKEAGRKGAKKRWNKRSDKGANRGAIKGVNADKIRLDKIKVKSSTSNSFESAYPFEEFWDDYGKKREREKAESKWESISEKDRLVIKDFIPIYKKSLESTDYQKYPTTFLNSRIWRDDWGQYPPKQNISYNGNSTKPNKGDQHVQAIREILHS